MRKPSDYAHAFGEPAPRYVKASRLADDPAQDGASEVGPKSAASTEEAASQAASQTANQAAAEAPTPSMELATFRLLYESDRICVFETRDGHLTTVDVNRLA